jgi:cell division cycle protein 37
MQGLNAEIACNGVLSPRLQDIQAKLSADPSPLTYISNLVDQLQTNPSPDAPPTNAPGQPTYDGMVLTLLLQVSEEAKNVAGDKGEDAVGAKVKEGLAKHLVQLAEHTEKLKKELVEEEKEQKKHITSEDMHDGFDSRVSPVDTQSIIYC